jgi:hypothetical protein
MSEPGYVIWKAWRDGMLAQGREVAPERMEWETLPLRDKALDERIERQASEAALSQFTPERIALLEGAERKLLDYWWQHGKDDAGLNSHGQAMAMLRDLRLCLAAPCPTKAAEHCGVDHEAALAALTEKPQETAE